jgi:DNA repair protein RecO (recombination protein O)
MYLKIQGLVLRRTEYNDHDVLLTILSKQHGKITAKARGLRRKNSPLTAQCQLLAFAEFTLFEYRGMYTINEAATIELFHDLRRDLGKLALGTYFAQAAEVISQEDLPNPELQSLVLNCLYALSKLNEPEMKVKAAFELRLSCIAGFQPELSGCQGCGNAFPDRFDLKAGMLECAQCRDPESDGIRMPIGPGVLDAMRYLCECDSRKLFAFRLPEEATNQLAQVTEGYLTTQLERGFSSLDFYKSLLI